MEIIDIYNNKFKTGCLGCSIAKGDFSPPGGLIYQTEHFCINQDCEIPIPGFLIISSKRHIQRIDEFTEEETAEFIDTAMRVRKALLEAGFDQINFINVEQGEHHLHFWFFPVTEEIREKFGFGVKSIKPAMEYAKENWKTEERIKLVEECIDRLKKYLV